MSTHSSSGPQHTKVKILPKISLVNQCVSFRLLTRVWVRGTYRGRKDSTISCFTKSLSYHM